MKGRNAILLAGLVLLAGAGFVVYHLNDFARVQAVEIGNTVVEKGTPSQVVIQNRSSRKIAFQLRCDREAQPPSGPQVIQARGSLDLDVNPELAGRELPRMIADKTCEATWRGPLGTSCRAWRLRWEYGRPTRKGIIMAEEDGACRIATCYSTSRLVNIPSCLSAVYLSGAGRQRKP